MRWLHAEYLLKGLFLGLLLFVALHEADWQAFGLANLAAFGGLGLAVAIAAFRKTREGYQAKGRPFTFLVFLLLESPEIIYAGVLLGMGGAAYLIHNHDADGRLLGTLAGGGLGLGILFWLLRYVQQRGVRLTLNLLLAALLVTAGLLWFGQLGSVSEQLGLNDPIKDRIIFGTQLLLGVPLFYVLAFSGREEETEIEVGAVCAAMGLGGMMLSAGHGSFQSIGIIVPAMLYFWYTMQVLSRLRVFKHAIRGLSYTQAGRYRQAILAFRRALRFDPGNSLAREGLWSVHRSMDLSQLANDPETLKLVDLDMCLDRAGSLLLQAQPSPEKLQEAHRLLDLVLNQRPAMRPAVHYWRAVAFTHEQKYEQAASELSELLDPNRFAADDGQRRSVLLQAWQLALRAHPELTRRVGTPQLTLPLRRMDAIGAVERHLAQTLDDTEIWGFKRVLYQDLTETEYEEKAGPGGIASDFDHAYAQQLGLALINDSARWRRGEEYLRMAARGLPALGPSIFSQIAQAHQREGHGDEAWHNYELAIRAGRAVGVKNLAEEDRHAYFAAVKLLGDSALAHQDYDRAIENYQLYTESERSGLETLRVLADLFERKGDVFSALRVTEKGLLYDAKDKDLLARKDRYYYSIMPDDLRSRLDTIRESFDVVYCLKKARAILDAKSWDLDSLDWGQHLAELARVAQPESLAAKVLVARARLRRGEKEEAVALFEEVRAGKPEVFASTDDEEAWYLTCKMLGELYLHDFNRADLAVECFKSFRQSSKSGADTMYKLGQAYEQLGDRVRAIKFYKHVVAYEGHPLAHEAYDALHRLEAG